MPFFNKSYRTGTLEHVIGCHGNGNILQGEADMFKRIQADCEKSNLNWYVWYDLSLPIPYAGQSEIQIDFLLICEKGAIVLEVKGGNIQVIGGRYYYCSNGGTLTQMKTSPFDQANNYKWALLNHNVLNSDQLFVSYAVAFPHQSMEYTNRNEQIDKSFWLWEKNSHDDANSSFADFCEDILDYTRENSSKKNYIDILSNEELKSIVDILSPTIEDKSHYSKSSLNEVLEWLNIENIDILLILVRCLLLASGLCWDVEWVGLNHQLPAMLFGSLVTHATILAKHVGTLVVKEVHLWLWVVVQVEHIATCGVVVTAT